MVVSKCNLTPTFGTLYSGNLANNVLDEHILADVETLFIVVFRIHSLTSQLSIISSKYPLVDMLDSILEF